MSTKKARPTLKQLFDNGYMAGCNGWFYKVRRMPEAEAAAYSAGRRAGVHDGMHDIDDCPAAWVAYSATIGAQS